MKIKNKNVSSSSFTVSRKIHSSHELENVFSFIPESRKIKIIKYNEKIMKKINISKYDYQKFFIENFIKNHDFVDISKYKISNLINYFKSTFKNFTKGEDTENLKKIILELPQSQEYKK